MTHDDQLPAVLANARVIFFDFDGPVCDVFAGLPAHDVAKQLTALLSSQDPAAGSKAAETDDPIEVCASPTRRTPSSAGRSSRH
ncbi:hypothetical protein ACFC0D_22215 [Streptomyces sp. NPDC056222]|uniref:hypothetical protein n=1 Tax=Streptomyces sp. NPDC056222 TaxID=3345749 RepID=UPI0035DCABEB